MRLLFTLLICIPFLAKASTETDPPGARAAGMAGSGLCFQDIWSIYQNQAGMARIEAPTAGVFYENKFLVKGLAYTGFAGALPLGNGAIGLSYSNFGYSAYHEGKIGLAYGMKLNKRMAIGVRLNYNTIRIAAEDYGKTSALSAEVGFQIEVSDKVMLAAHISNPTRTRLDDFDDERLPTVLRIGAAYRLSDDLLLTGDVAKDIDRDFTVRGGIEYQPAEILYLRIGATNNPGIFAFGLGLNLNKFQFDLAAGYHRYLGYSPQVSLTFAPGKK